MLGACSSPQQIQPGIAASEPVVALGQEGYEQFHQAQYQLLPSDVLTVRVFREPDLSIEQVPISADGEISLPLIGPVEVAGQTPMQLEMHLEELLAERYLRVPDVMVNVMRYGSHLLTVEGQVEAPGVYEFAPGTRLSGGIAMASGPTRVSDLREVAVFRETTEGLQVAKFDYQAVRGGQMLDPILRPGDRVVVGTDGLSVFWQDFLRALPLFALFSNANF